MIVTPLLIVFLIIVFVLVWLFVNTIDKRKWLTILISLLLTPVIYFYAFYPFINVFASYHHQKYFNAESWKEKPSLRYEMIDNTLEKKLLIGKTKNEILQLLGKQEWHGYNKTLKQENRNKWNYNLGVEPGVFNRQQECLEIEFVNDTVKSTKHYQMKLQFND